MTKQRESMSALPSMAPEDVAAVEAILGYTFGNKDLLAEALTHGSFYHPGPAGRTYERLEFLGDSVVNFVVAQEMFTSYPGLPEGDLTDLLSANVDKETLGRVAVTHGLLQFLRRRKEDVVDEQIANFMEGMSKYPIHSNGQLDTPKLLSDITESLIAAIYLDSKYDLGQVSGAFLKLANPLISPATLGKNPKTELNVLCQKRGLRLSTEEYLVDGDLMIEILIDGERFARTPIGRGKKKIAEIRAAKAALEKLKGDLR